MFAFSSARRALRCAIGIQFAFATYNDEHSDEPVRVGIGLHTGEAIRRFPLPISVGGNLKVS